MTDHIGHQRAEQCADKAGEIWKRKARAAFVAVAKRQKEFTCGTARRFLEEKGVTPHDNRAWGHIARSAAKDGIVTPTNRWVPTGSHHRPDRVWRSKVFKE